MLLNLDEAKYLHEEYEHQLAAFRLERKLRKARATDTPKLSLLARCVHLLSHLLAVRCQRRERAAAHQPVQRWQTLPSGK